MLFRIWVDSIWLSSSWDSHTSSAFFQLIFPGSLGQDNVGFFPCVPCPPLATVHHKCWLSLRLKAMVTKTYLSSSLSLSLPAVVSSCESPYASAHCLVPSVCLSFLGFVIVFVCVCVCARARTHMCTCRRGRVLWVLSLSCPEMESFEEYFRRAKNQFTE